MTNHSSRSSLLWPYMGGGGAALVGGSGTAALAGQRHLAVVLVAVTVTLGVLTLIVRGIWTVCVTISPKLTANRVIARTGSLPGGFDSELYRDIIGAASTGHSPTVPPPVPVRSPWPRRRFQASVSVLRRGRR